MMQWIILVLSDNDMSSYYAMWLTHFSFKGPPADMLQQNDAILLKKPVKVVFDKSNLWPYDVLKGFFFSPT